MTAANRLLRQATPFALLLLASLAAVGLVIGISVGIGDLPIPLTTTFAAVTNRLGWTAVELNRIHETVIWDYRLSRALVAAFCGAGLALSGAIMRRKTILHLLANLLFATILFGALLGGPIVMLILLSERLAL